MSRYILRRLLMIFPTAFGVVTLVFLIMHLAPGDPARLALGADATTADVKALRQHWGLDDPVYIQYGRFVRDLARGDLGTTLTTRESVGKVILSRLPVTLQLTVLSLLVSVIMGVSAGLVSALKRNSLLDYLTLSASVIGYCIPNFWLALVLIIVFSVNLRWLPSLGTKGVLDFRHWTLPTIALAAPSIALLARLTRSGMLEVLGEDYLRTARAKGLGERVVVSRHALRNAMIPIVTVVGLQFGGLLGGTVVVETIFSLPGIGWLLFSSIGYREYPVIRAVVLYYSIAFMCITLLVDIAYCWLDPRVRYD